MLVDKQQYLANVLKDTKFVLVMLDEDGESTDTMISDQLTSLELVWIVDCLKTVVASINSVDCD